MTPAVAAVKKSKPPIITLTEQKIVLYFETEIVEMEDMTDSKSHPTKRGKGADKGLLMSTIDRDYAYGILEHFKTLGKLSLCFRFSGGQVIRPPLSSKKFI